MVTNLTLGDTKVEVRRKAIKNVHLSVYPPTGAVRISAPEQMKLDTIRVYALSKLDWIRKQQRKIGEQERESPREYLERESHYVWGDRYLLTITEENQRPVIELSHRRLNMRLRPRTSQVKREALLEQWYRHQLRNALPPLIKKWESIMKVEVAKFFIQRMKTKWGSCNHHRRTIRLNTDLAKKPKPCLEYIVVHEMVHLLEPTHNQRFQDLMKRFMPNWKVRRDALNSLPLRHVDWTY